MRVSAGAAREYISTDGTVDLVETAGRTAMTISLAHKLALATLAALASVVMPLPAAGTAAWRASATRTQSVRDTARLHKTGVEGSIVFEQGNAEGALPGEMRVRLDTNVPFRASFTLKTHAGTLRGHGSATPCEQKCSGHYESFRGVLVIDGGSGRYAHARGRGGLYGVFDRDTYGVEVQTTGTLSY
jgi:hypothetical protein